MKIINSPGCNNSPKNRFIEDYSIKLLARNIEELKLLSDENILLIFPENLRINGISEFERLTKEWTVPIDLLECIASISHGKQASFLGKLTAAGKSYDISIHYEFKTLRADKIKSVLVFLEKRA